MDEKSSIYPFDDDGSPKLGKFIFLVYDNS